MWFKWCLLSFADLSTETKTFKSAVVIYLFLDTWLFFLTQFKVTLKIKPVYTKNKTYVSTLWGISNCFGIVPSLGSEFKTGGGDNLKTLLMRLVIFVWVWSGLIKLRLLLSKSVCFSRGKSVLVYQVYEPQKYRVPVC